jgi:hypothetical protein
MSLPDRIDLIRQVDTLTGLDFVQVSADQMALHVFLTHIDMPAALATALEAISPANVSITAISKIEPETVNAVSLSTPLPTVDGRRVLHIHVDQPGGFGFYRLFIDHPTIDTYFNDLVFSFKAECPTEFDCKPDPHECPEESPVDFPVDYRARDFWSYRQVLTDFASQRYPDWQDRLEADIGIMLVDLLSALGDEFSYAQDRIARESNFATATQRKSIRHFARLVDYHPDNGSGAQTWLDVTVNANNHLDAGTPVTDARSQLVFEIGHGLSDLGKQFALATSRNEFSAYIWDENDTCLPVGSMNMTIAGNHAGEFVPDIDIDPVGKWVLLKTTPVEPDVPQRRILVRVIHADDSNDPLSGDPVTEIFWDQPIEFELDLETLAVRANLVPATSGLTIPAITESALRFRIGPAAHPADPDAGLPLAIERAGANTSCSYLADDDGRVKYLFSLPGSDETPLVWLPHDHGTRPEIILEREPGEAWSWLPAMIGEEVAKPTQKVFTLDDGAYRKVFSIERFGVETSLEDYASAKGFTVRFGDNEFGMAPKDGDIFQLRFRLGNGRLMNVAADSLTRFLSEFDTPPTSPAFVDSITNPLMATGGRDPETNEQIRINAPQDYQTIAYRAVRPEDYEEIAERLEWVQNAGAKFRWTGSWPTVFVTPDPFDEVGLSSENRTELQELMDRVRQAGRQVCVREPAYANIDLEIRICVAEDAYPGDVKERVLIALFGNRHATGFFDPDNFTFATPLSRAALIASIQDVPGVHAVDGMRIRRRGWFDWRPFSEYLFRVADNELINVTNNRFMPEQGAVRLIMEGGA